MTSKKDPTIMTKTVSVQGAWNHTAASLSFVPGNLLNAHEHPPIEMKAPYGPMGCVLKHHSWVTVSHIICLFFYSMVTLVTMELWSKKKHFFGLGGDLILVFFCVLIRKKKFWNPKTYRSFSLERITLLSIYRWRIALLSIKNAQCLQLI